MGNSLQDQLLGAGLVAKDKARRVEVEKRRKQKQKQKNKQGTADQQQLRARQQLADDKARDQALNRQRAEQAAERAVEAQISDLIKRHKMSTDNGESPYNFAFNNRVVRLFVSDKQRIGLGQGRLALVRDGDGFAIVPSQIAEKINSRKENIVVVWNTSQQSAQIEPDKDDPYKDFEVPDDLIW